MHRESIQRYLIVKLRATDTASWNVLQRDSQGTVRFNSDIEALEHVCMGKLPQQWLRVA